MEEVIAGLEGFTFAFEKDVEMQRGIGLLPFQGMDKSGSAVCNFFAKGLCEKGKLCPLRHDQGGKVVVCKHWLRGLCKKGDQCKFLHQYDVARMPECYFYSKFEPPPSVYSVGPAVDVSFRLPLQLLDWPLGSAPPASAWGPRKPPLPMERLLLPAPMRPREQLVSHRQGLRVQEQGACHRCRKMGHCASKCSKTELVRVIETSAQVCLGPGGHASVGFSVPSIP
ncbi:Putative cleavage and polyadenylation specificity factor subunit 4-like protein [Pteropus alecto]|uniref:Cleavage and polyadenylation specificity factor subunit 4 n=1 Tax=Pteropus alecto TaxID=9402 RepID=L5KLL0_PTEAL|nr:Putative cleavage and polyadenylation specificity factor subunit 4-like protein [Pteropus alecto]